MRIWGKLFKENHLLRDTVVEENGPESRTQKVYAALHEIVMRFDLPEPIWLDQNIRDFKRTAKVRFRADSFIEAVDFDYLEFHVIEEDLFL